MVHQYSEEMKAARSLIGTQVLGSRIIPDEMLRIGLQEHLNESLWMLNENESIKPRARLLSSLDSIAGIQSHSEHFKRKTQTVFDEFTYMRVISFILDIEEILLESYEKDDFESICSESEYMEDSSGSKRTLSSRRVENGRPSEAQGNQRSTNNREIITEMNMNPNFDARVHLTLESHVNILTASMETFKDNVKIIQESLVKRVREMEKKLQ